MSFKTSFKFFFAYFLGDKIENSQAVKKQTKINPQQKTETKTKHKRIDWRWKLWTHNLMKASGIVHILEMKQKI